MKPTDDDLNRAMAEALGWRQRINVQWEEDHDGFAGGNNGWLQPRQADSETEGERYCPDFCHDRNTLPAVWDSFSEGDKPPVGIGGRWSTFGWHLRELVLRRPRMTYDTSFSFGGCDLLRMISAEPRLQVIAALRALDLWKAEWDEEDGGE